MSGIVINADVAPSPGNPHSWMPLLGEPAGSEGPGGIRVLYGVLRPVYRSYTNSAAALARAKLTVGAPADAPDWTVTAHRAEVILPAHADDRLRDPRALFEAADAEHPVKGDALATYVTLTWQPERLHAQFRVACELASWLADSHGLGVLAVQHVPGRQASSACPHVHLLFPPRTVDAWSMLGAWARPFCRDAGRQLIADRVAALAGTRS